MLKLYESEAKLDSYERKGERAAYVVRRVATTESF